MSATTGAPLPAALASPALLGALRCPTCGEALSAAGAALACGQGHTLDVARQGYVHMLGSAKGAGMGDDAAMVAAREQFLGAGHFAPLVAALGKLAAETPQDGLLVEVGAGTGYYAAGLLAGLPAMAGLAVDLSKHAARRAARAHPRLASVVADVHRLPLADGCASLLLDVFAPRDMDEFRRVLRPDGRLLMVTPTSRHLEEGQAALGLLKVHPEKAQRLEAATRERFERVASRELEWKLALGRDAVAALAGMGPSARHTTPEQLAERLAARPEPIVLTASLRVELYRPIG